jgi:carbon monoxide dehydrogenase subunit G
MRFIKLLLLSGFFFAVLLFLLSLLLPARAVVERSGVIDAPIATVYGQVNDLKTWQSWNPWMEAQDVTFSATTAGTGAYGNWIVSQSQKHIPGKVSISNTEPDKGVYYNMDFEGLKPVKGTFNFKPSSDGKGTVIMWRVETQLGYLPWWKFRGFLADRLTGPQLEDGLTKLKSICEGGVKY